MIKKNLFVCILTCFAIAGHAQQSNTFLWRINNPANKKPSYLFGTIHLPQEQFMLLSDSVYNAVNKTDYFYGELDYANAYSEMQEEDGFFQSKLDFLDSVRKTDSWKRMIMSINRSYHVNIDPDSLNQYTEFGQKILADYMKPDPGVTALDLSLSSYAITLGKTAKGLETFKFQIGMLYTIIEARLSDTTLLFDDEVVLTANMKRFYTAQQFDSMSNLIESINPTYKRIVFDNRNSTMADSMQNISAGKTAFFAVGCGHLLGSKGILNLLRARGMQLTPVFSKNKISITLMQALMKTAAKNIKRELKKEMEKDAAEKDAPKEQIEELKEDMKIEIPEPPAKPATKKVTPKKTKGKN
jgi:hypothetical protein